MVLAIRKKPLYQISFMMLSLVPDTLNSKGVSLGLGLEEGYEEIFDFPGIDVLAASTMLYYGLPIYLAVNVIDKGIGAIEFGSSLISKPSEAEKVAERQPESAGLGV